MAHYEEFEPDPDQWLAPLEEDSDPLSETGFFPRVPVGTVLFAPAGRVADSLKGYRFNVQFCDERGVWMQQVQFTGKCTDKGLEVIVLEDAPAPVE